jgi:hypothetical protein
MGNRSAFRTALSALAALPVFLSPGPARADSISPSSFSATIPVSGTTSVNKTVTVSAGGAASLVDVFFLADTTGSMGTVLNAVKTSASTILSTSFGSASIAWGVGEYKDTGDGGDFTADAFRLNQDLTTNTALANTAIGTWIATGGGDTPEGQIAAMKAAADTVSWRAGSQRIMVWFGDAPGHDPVGTPAVTEAGATSALQGEGIKVEAIGTTTGVSGDLNADPDGAGPLLAGQANRITAATGGAYTSGVNSAAIVAAIQAAINAAVTTYSSVCLDLSEAPAGVGAASVPACYTGSFDRSVDRTFGFTLGFTGVSAGDYSFNVYATVDGGRVATEADRICVGGTPGAACTATVPLPGTLALLGAALLAAGFVRRRIA